MTRDINLSNRSHSLGIQQHIKQCTVLVPSPEGNRDMEFVRGLVCSIEGLAPSVCMRFQIHGKESIEIQLWAIWFLSSTNLVSL